MTNAACASFSNAFMANGLTQVSWLNYLPSRRVLVIVMVMTQTLPLAEVKAHLSSVVDGVERSHERVTITRHGQPAAVLVAVDDLAALEDTLELLTDPAAMAEIDEGRRAAAQGKGLDAQAVRARYLDRSR